MVVSRRNSACNSCPELVPDIQAERRFSSPDSMYFQLAGPYWWSLITRALIRSANWARLRPPGRCQWYGVAASGHVMDPSLTLEIGRAACRERAGEVV